MNVQRLLDHSIVQNVSSQLNVTGSWRSTERILSVEMLLDRATVQIVHVFSTERLQDRSILASCSQQDDPSS